MAATEGTTSIGSFVVVVAVDFLVNIAMKEEMMAATEGTTSSGSFVAVVAVDFIVNIAM